jgi:hypothetical protein
MRSVLSALLPQFAVASILSAQQPAQNPCWRVPPHGLVRYVATGALQRTDADGRVMGDVGADTEMLPLLFADELDGARLRGEPWSLPAVAVWIAADLGPFAHPGPVERSYPRVAPCGEVHFTGEAGPPAADGWQEIRGRLSRRPVNCGANGGAASGGDAELARLLGWYLDEALDGTLTVRRHFDAQRGVIDELAWTLDASSSERVDEAQHRPIRLHGEVCWRLRDVLEHAYGSRGDGPGFGEAVRAASAAAAERQERILLAGTDATVFAAEGRGNLVGPSLQAAMLLGLGRAGRRSGDAGVDDAVVRLVAKPPTQAQGLALLILALVELAAPADARQARLRGAPPAASDVPARWRAPLQQAVHALLALARRGAGAADDAQWWTFADDVHSWRAFYTWTAALALDAATRAGVAVPDAVFARVARHLVAVAVPAGPARPLQLRREDDTAPTAAAAVVPLGWTDGPEVEPCLAHGAATAGAMAALLACRRHLRDAPLIGRVDAAVQGGFAWLDAHWTPRASPTELPVLRQYASEFALAMAFLFDESRVRWLGDRDLYFELASACLHRLDTQHFPLPTVLGDPAALCLWRPGRAPVTGAPAAK